MIGHDDYMEEGDIGSTLDLVKDVPEEPQPQEEKQEQQVTEAVKDLTIDTDNVPLAEQFPSSPLSQKSAKPTLEKKATDLQVEGFQLVQATGLSDTATPAPKGSHIPEYATASPAAQVTKPPPPKTDFGFSSTTMPQATPAASPVTPFEDNSKSKQFNQRFDVILINVVYDC